MGWPATSYSTCPDEGGNRKGARLRILPTRRRSQVCEQAPHQPSQAHQSVLVLVRVRVVPLIRVPVLLLVVVGMVALCMLRVLLLLLLCVRARPLGDGHQLCVQLGHGRLHALHDAALCSSSRRHVRCVAGAAVEAVRVQALRQQHCGWGGGWGLSGILHLAAAV